MPTLRLLVALVAAALLVGCGSWQRIGQGRPVAWPVERGLPIADVEKGRAILDRAAASVRALPIGRLVARAAKANGLGRDDVAVEYRYDRAAIRTIGEGSGLEARLHLTPPRIFMGQVRVDLSYLATGAGGEDGPELATWEALRTTLEERLRALFEAAARAEGVVLPPPGKPRDTE